MRGRSLVAVAIAAVLSLGVVACGDEDSSSKGGEVKAPKGPKALAKLGQGEGKVNLIAWAGYVEDGHIRDVAYAGMVTRYLVELDAGGELQVVRQNLETSSADALEQKGRRVRIGWREEHTYAVDDKEQT